MEEGKTETAAFNMALKYLERLHELKNHCNNATLAKDYESKYNGVLCIFAELYPKMSEDDIKTFRELMTKSRIVLKSRVKHKKDMVRFDKNFLFETELFLSKVMNDLGLLMPGRDDPGMAMLR